MIIEYIDIMFATSSVQSKKNRKNELQKLHKGYKLRGNIPINYQYFIVWKTFKITNFDPFLKKHHIVIDDLLLGHKKRMIYNTLDDDSIKRNNIYLLEYLRLMSPNAEESYLQNRRVFLRKSIANGKTNIFIRNFFEFYKMKYIVQEI